jgi:hypothetical protein
VLKVSELTCDTPKGAVFQRVHSNSKQVSVSVCTLYICNQTACVAAESRCRHACQRPLLATTKDETATKAQATAMLCQSRH